MPVWLTTRCAQRENSAAASGQTTRPCGITWGKYREFRRSCCRDEIAQLTKRGGALLKMMGCQETARRRARRDDDGATRGSDVLERARESDIGTERCPLSEPCRGRGPARACRKSPSSLPRRTASARCLASRTGSRRFGAPPSSRDRRGASRASNAGRTRAMPLPSETRGSSLEKNHPNRTRRARSLTLPRVAWSLVASPRLETGTKVGTAIFGGKPSLRWRVRNPVVEGANPVR